MTKTTSGDYLGWLYLETGGKHVIQAPILEMVLNVVMCKEKEHVLLPEENNEH